MTVNGGLVGDRQWGVCRGFDGHGGSVGTANGELVGVLIVMGGFSVFCIASCFLV